MHGAVHVLAKITFYLLFVSHPYLNWWHLFSFFFWTFCFFLISDSGTFDVPPFFYSFFKFFHGSLILNWISTCWWSLFRVFLKEILFFRLKDGAMDFYWCFRINKHGHISFRIMIAWFLERLTPATDFSDSQYLSFF